MEKGNSKKRIAKANRKWNKGKKIGKGNQEKGIGKRKLGKRNKIKELYSNYHRRKLNCIPHQSSNVYSTQKKKRG